MTESLFDAREITAVYVTSSRVFIFGRDWHVVVKR